MTAATPNPLLTKPREQWVELFSGDFEPRMQELQREMQEAIERESSQQRFGSSRSESMRLAKEYDELVEQARAHGIVRLRLRGAGRAWRQLKDEHPPRPDNEDDENLGVNRKTFFEPAVALCIAEPDFTAEQYDEMLDVLSSAQWDRLSSVAWIVNEGEVNIPKSSAVSLLRQMSGEDSKSVESTESTPAPSTASRRRKSKSTSTQTDDSPAGQSSPDTHPGTPTPEAKP